MQTRKEYSPISRVMFKNFRNIGEVNIDFENSPIVSLIGDNEAGKTSLVKGLAVASKHINTRDQKNYIRDGMDGWGVAIYLQDGTAIIRMKGSSYNKYRIIYPDKTEWSTSKIDSGLPQEVQNLMGIVEEEDTKQLLQFRTYEDMLLFVMTPSSTNYKVMYNALHVEQITKGIKVGSAKANQCRQEITKLSVATTTMEESIRNLPIINIDRALLARESLTEQVATVEEMTSTLQLQDENEKLNSECGALADLDDKKLVPFDMELITTLCDVASLIEEVKELTKKAAIPVEIEQMQWVDASVLTDLIEAQTVKRSNINEEAKINVIGSLEGLEIPNISELINTGAEIKKISDEIQVLSSYIPKYDEFITGMETYFKSVGAKVINCHKCGETIVLTEEAV